MIISVYLLLPPINHDNNVVDVVNNGGLPNVMVDLISKKKKKKGSSKLKGKNSTSSLSGNAVGIDHARYLEAVKDDSTGDLPEEMVDLMEGTGKKKQIPGSDTTYMKFSY